ncbi:hypothetical protein [Marinobacter sp. X15-166B]|uniref:hypothetical protein n=1 Tax=Marinobacter sp. X15-166B TaxID=1897620 RepID=UPI00085CC221|nr:hypothetical protein [Marinobacter sp. X15-166B]OEY65071.1 hypothetical protein BG841_00355 [Marinobacter sp. X15-166B]
MSLMNSLARIGASLSQASGQRAQAAATHKAEPPVGKPGEAQATDSVTLSGGVATKAASRLAVHQYKSDVGQDTVMLKETLRHKLAEYRLHPDTQVTVSKSDSGALILAGGIPADKKLQIEQDLNNDKAFRQAFARLSVTEPALTFVDTALKLNQAYGVNNSLLDALVSDNQQFNGLGDLVHRYDNLRQTLGNLQAEARATQHTYAVRLNARA